MDPITIVIESPRGSQAKYKFEKKSGHFLLHKLLPVGMFFPYDFGFIPGTRGDDGDPLDAMMIAEFPAFTGARMKCRLVGALLAEQRTNDLVIRNDRFFFVPEDSLLFSHIGKMEDFGSRHNEQLSGFFINYNRAEEKYFTPLQYIKPAPALKLIRSAAKK